MEGSRRGVAHGRQQCDAGRVQGEAGGGTRRAADDEGLASTPTAKIALPIRLRRRNMRRGKRSESASGCARRRRRRLYIAKADPQAWR